MQLAISSFIQGLRNVLGWIAEPPRAPHCPAPECQGEGIPTGKIFMAPPENSLLENIPVVFHWYKCMGCGQEFLAC